MADINRMSRRLNANFPPMSKLLIEKCNDKSEKCNNLGVHFGGGADDAILNTFNV